MFDQYKILTFFRNNQYVSFTVVLYFLLTETNQLIVMWGIMPVRDSRWLLVVPPYCQETGSVAMVAMKLLV